MAPPAPWCRRCAVASGECIKMKKRLLAASCLVSFLAINPVAAADLARISHSVEAHRGANQRKLLCSNDFCLIQGAPRCRQSVAQNDLILEWWKVGLWKRPLMAGW